MAITPAQLGELVGHMKMYLYCSYCTMPTKYKRKATVERGNWSKEILENAVEAIGNVIAKKWSAENCGIPLGKHQKTSLSYKKQFNINHKFNALGSICFYDIDPTLRKSEGGPMSGSIGMNRVEVKSYSELTQLDSMLGSSLESNYYW